MIISVRKDFTVFLGNEFLYTTVGKLLFTLQLQLALSITPVTLLLHLFFYDTFYLPVTLIPTSSVRKGRQKK